MNLIMNLILAAVAGLLAGLVYMRLASPEWGGHPLIALGLIVLIAARWMYVAIRRQDEIDAAS